MFDMAIDYPANKKALMNFLHTSGLKKFSLKESNQGFILRYKQKCINTNIMKIDDFSFLEWDTIIREEIAWIKKGKEKEKKEEKINKYEFAQLKITAGTRTENGERYPINMEALFYYLTVICEFPPFKIHKRVTDDYYFIYYSEKRLSTQIREIRNLSLTGWAFKISDTISLISKNTP